MYFPLSEPDDPNISKYEPYWMKICEMVANFA